MKKAILCAILCSFVCILFVSCNKQEEDDTLCNVRLVVNDFEIYEEGFEGKSTRVDSSAHVQCLTVVVFDAQGNECERMVHSKINGSSYYTANFGSFYFLLPTGDYKIVTIGNWSNPDDTNYRLVLASPTVAAFVGNASDCFGNVQDITISSTSENLISVTLSRMVAAMNLRSTDTAPQGFDSVRMSLTKGSLQFNPTTGAALANTGVTQTFKITPEDVGYQLRYVLYTFLPNNRETADFTFTIYGQQGSPLIERTFVNVPLKRNRRTIAEGALFDGINNAFRVEVAWEADTTINF